MQAQESSDVCRLREALPTVEQHSASSKVVASSCPAHQRGDWEAWWDSSNLGMMQEDAWWQAAEDGVLSEAGIPSTWRAARAREACCRSPSGPGRWAYSATSLTQAVGVLARQQPSIEGVRAGEGLCSFGGDWLGLVRVPCSGIRCDRAQ